MSSRASRKRGAGADASQPDSESNDGTGHKKTKAAPAAAAAAVAVNGSSSSSSGSGGGVVRLQGPGGARYAFVPVSVKATVGDVAAGAGLNYIRGYYEVGNKKEDVSATKELVLLMDSPAALAGSGSSEPLMDSFAEVRAKLAMGTGKASINGAMVRAAAGPNARLFVMSTSGNRGLLPGSTLCTMEEDSSADGSAAPAPVSLASLFAAHYSADSAAAAGAGAGHGAVVVGSVKAANSDRAEGDDGSDSEDMDEGTASSKSSSAAAAGATGAVAGADGLVRLEGRNGASYVFMRVDSAQTISAANAVLAARGGPVAPLAVMYEVDDSKKQEQVSAGKAMILLMDSPSNLAARSSDLEARGEKGQLEDDAATIRRWLSMGEGKASVGAAQVRDVLGKGARLFVQSSSHNRRLLPGATLCVKEAPGDGTVSASVGKSAGSKSGPKASGKAKPPAKKGKGKGKDEEEEDEEEDDGGGGGGGSGPPGGGGPPDGDGDGGDGGGGPLSPYLVLLPFIRWSYFAEEGLDTQDLFPADSPWGRLHADAAGGLDGAARVPNLVDEEVPPPLQSRARAMMAQVKALGFEREVLAAAAEEEEDGAPAAGVSAATTVTSSSASATRVASPRDGWFRDSRLERRIRQQLSAPAGEARGESVVPSPADCVIRAHVHSSAPHSLALVLLSLGEDVGDFLLLTRGADFVLLGCPGAHPVLACNQFSYGNSDGSGPTLVVTVEAAARGWGPPGCAATDVDDVAHLFALIEKYFDEFCKDQHH